MTEDTRRPHQVCKDAGLKGLNELAELSSVSVQTLNNWHRKHPRRFKLLLIGACSFKSSMGVFTHG